MMGQPQSGLRNVTAPMYSAAWDLNTHMWHETPTASPSGQVDINLFVEYFATLTPPPCSELWNLTVVMHAKVLAWTKKMKAPLVIALWLWLSQYNLSNRFNLGMMVECEVCSTRLSDAPSVRLGYLWQNTYGVSCRFVYMSWVIKMCVRHFADNQETCCERYELGLQIILCSVYSSQQRSWGRR